MSVCEEPSREDLLELVRRQAAELERLRGELERALHRIAELEGQVGGGRGSGTPPWVKRNVPARREGGVKERKKRDEGYARRREEPTRYEDVAAEVCPGCGQKLRGGSLVSSHQVIEIPRSGYEVVEYRRLRRWCGRCGKPVAPPPLPAGVAVDRRRFGPGVMSLVAKLVTMNRMTHRGVREHLETIHGLRLSEGTISGMLHAVADCGRGRYEALQEEIRDSGVVHADETGFRENGRNGYIWALATKLARVFHWEASRAHRVIAELLGKDFSSILVTDFYSAYTGLNCPHQWCWVHLLRAARELREQSPDDRALATWVEKLKLLHRRLCELRDQVAERPEAVRARASAGAETKLRQLAGHRVATTGPARTLGDRIRRHAHELVTFVKHPEVPPDNNAAERAIRPAVVARKVSGGTRSSRGTETKMILLSLFGTWALRGQNPLEACHHMLTAPT